MRRHAMDEWIDTGDEEGAAKAFDSMDERIRPPIGAQPRQITPSRTTLDACQRAGCPIEAGAIHAWLCTWSVRSIDGTVIRRDMLLIDVKRENEIWKATSRYRLDGIRTGRQAQAALLLAATGALRPIQEASRRLVTSMPTATTPHVGSSILYRMPRFFSMISSICVW